MLYREDAGAINNEKIKVALAICDSNGAYARHVSVVMASIFANTRSKVCVYLLHDDTLTDSNKIKLLKTAECFEQSVELINVQDRIGDCVPEDKRMSAGRATYFRLLIPSLFPFDKIIYLDCDVIVNMDIAELWHISIDDYALAAVLDSFAFADLKGSKDFLRLNVVYKLIGIQKNCYFNAGVLLLNLRKINRDYCFLSAVKDFFERYGKIIPFADQDFLNYVFYNDCLFIDDKFCRMDFSGIEADDVYGYILHLICDDKPWSSYTRPYVDNLYWEYLAKTPFCENNKTLIRTLLDDICRDEFYHLHSSDCKTQYKKKIWTNLKNAHLLSFPKVLWNCMQIKYKEINQTNLLEKRYENHRNPS